MALNRFFLLVDDDADDAALFCEALGMVGPDLKFYRAENGLGLFDVLSEHRPDVIFLDINMPKMGGWECLKRLKSSSEYDKIPVIMYSTSSANKDIDKAYNSGAALFITKPEDFRELVKILAVVATGLKDAQVTRLKEFPSVRVEYNI